ncbi:MFS transporter [Pseudonocardia alni]|uniref:MFS family permease n=1 Tax=Pseudonocardia alni TaxID=33907 RepID=A0A852W6J4_PSEA5|nr:MFS transporter [Pseudonocardia antarctica]NYG04120.1 MFS family permease [Pseudonocardia antarctica]
MASIESAAPPTAALPALYRRIAWRILPLLVICYLFAYIDRVNIGFAKLQMSEDIGISESVYGLAAGIFFLGYVIFEVPSNLLLRRIGTRKTIFRIMLLWGVTSAAMLFVHDAMSFYVLRFLLGVFEAGFAPGIIFYLTVWFPKARMGAAMSVLMIPGPLGSMIGGPVSSFLMTGLDGQLGLAGWQWMFLVEGLPCVLLAFVVWRCLPDGPDDARWLSGDERALLAQDLAATTERGEHRFRKVLTDPRVYGLAIGYFCLISGLYGISFWLPTILADTGVGSTVEIGLWSAVPYAAALVLMWGLARHSDTTGERRWHIVIPTIVGAAGLAVAAFTASTFGASMIALIVATASMWAAYTVFWSVPGSFLQGDAAAGGIAFINSIGLLGGFVSPTLIGFVRQGTGSAEIGLLTLVGLLVVGAISLAVTRIRTADPTPATTGTTVAVAAEEEAR